MVFSFPRLLLKVNIMTVFSDILDTKGLNDKQKQTQVWLYYALSFLGNIFVETCLMVKRLDPLYAKGKDWFGQVLGKDHLSERFASTEQETFAYPVFSGLRAYFNKMLIKALPVV